MTSSTAEHRILHNLPAALSRFLGREEETREIGHAVSQHRLVTLTGVGGCGKTRLALHAAADAIGQWPDGVWFAELASTARDEDVARVVARVFGLREEAGKTPLETLKHELRGRSLLLVLDNCEQVLDGSAELATQLLLHAPNVRMLSTSREPLGVEGEWTYRVPSLNTETGRTLFIERSRLVRPNFEPTSEEELAITQLVHQLDGLPLAIELAAARSRVMQPARILESLTDRFRLLTGGGRQKMPRQQTLEASVAWSYDLLEPDEKELAQRLSIMRDFNIDAAFAISGHSEDASVLELLTRLVDKSLIIADHAATETRYRFLETVRQFLLVRLQRSDELFNVRQLHLQHFLTLAERRAPDLASREGPKHLQELQANLYNIDSALEWAEATKATSDMLRFVIALSLFFELGGHLAHGGRWFARALALDGDTNSRADAPADTTCPVSLRARALWGSAHATFYGGHYEQALASAERALKLAEQSGDTWAEGRALNTLGALQSLAEPDAARALLARSVALGKNNDDNWAIGDGIKMATVSYYIQHDDAGCRAPLEELRRVGEALGSRFFLAWRQGIVGYFARHRGDFEAASTALASAAAHSTYVGDPSTGGFVECWSASLDFDMGRFDSARIRWERLLATAAATGSELALPETLSAMGWYLVCHNEPGAAVEMVEGEIDPMLAAGVPTWAAQFLLGLGAAQRMLGNLDAASAALERGTVQTQQLNNKFLEAQIQHEQALVLRARGDDAGAENLLHSALVLQTRETFRPDAIRTLESLAAIAASGESFVEATRIAGACDGLRAKLGLVRPPVEDVQHAALSTRLREELGVAEFSNYWNAARTVSLDEIVEYTTRMRGQRKRPSIGWDSLTPTELRVAALVAEGLSNPEIGERMFIARGTAKIHVAHIFSKLGVTSRAQLAALVSSRIA